MSIAAISYSSLKDASNEAKSVAKKLNAYANSIESTVYNKLNKYSGSWTSSIYTARNQANSKISELRTQANRYDTYADNLIDLREECKRVDKAVRTKVSALTATFKESHGIRNSKVENAISYFFTSAGNSTGFGRWLGGKKDEFKAGAAYLKASIKEWYNYEGGKDLITGMLVAALEVAIAIVSVVAAVATFVAGAVTFGAVLILIAGVVAGVIALANGVENFINEKRAYDATQNNDPATGKRLSAQNTIQDRLREGDIGGTDSTLLWIDLNNVSESRKWATGIDVVNLCCTIVTVVNSCGKLLENSYKWATGNSMEHFTDIFSKDFLNGIGKNIKDGFTDIKAAFKLRDWSAIKDFGRGLLDDFKYNLDKNYRFREFPFRFAIAADSKEVAGVVKDLADTTKTYLSISKDLAEGGLNLPTIFKTGMENIVIPCITVFAVTKDSPDINVDAQGQLYFDFFKRVTIDDFYGIIDKVSSKIIESPVFDSGDMIKRDVLSKLSSSCNIKISIPDIYVPDVHWRAVVPEINVSDMSFRAAA